MNDDPKLYHIIELQDGTEGVYHITYAEAHKLSWSMIGRGYETREELVRKEGLITCSCCGQEAGTNYCTEVAERLRRLQLCHTCDFWMEKIRWAEHPDPLHQPVRVDGKHYCYDPRNLLVSGDSRYKGFGGSFFKICFLDTADVVVTNDLWHQGDIPARFRDRLPDNAVFLPS